MKVSEFAKIMGVSTVSVYRLIESDSIPYYKIGKSIRLNIDDFRKGKESGYEELQIED
ncbi:MAG: helix-turn-helix domain-containing protein [Mogibacterium sp.]|nr:helix-turn-helix domain-containing protein [Mogibacterium sp.]